MEQTSMTALICAFSRVYHAEHNEVKIFDDSMAKLLFTSQECEQIAKSLTEGIAFFHPDFQGTDEEALRYVVEQQLSPAPLGRAAFTEQALQQAVAIGANQYLLLGAGYDTFSYRQPTWAHKLTLLEIDHPTTAKDKQERLERAHVVFPDNLCFIAADFTKEDWPLNLLQNEKFHREQISFCSILGLVYYLSKETFERMLSTLSDLLPPGSSIVFDYPDEKSYTEQAGERAKKQAILAGAANEQMLASYSYREMEKLLSLHGFLIYEHLSPSQMTEQYFDAYNGANKEHPMTAMDNVNYCLAVKQGS